MRRFRKRYSRRRRGSRPFGRRFGFRRFRMRTAMTRKRHRPELKYSTTFNDPTDINGGAFLQQTLSPITLPTGPDSGERIGNRVKYLTCTGFFDVRTDLSVTATNYLCTVRVIISSPRIGSSAYYNYFSTDFSPTIGFPDPNVGRTYWDKTYILSNAINPLAAGTGNTTGTGQLLAIRKKFFIKFPRNVQFQTGGTAPLDPKDYLYIWFFNISGNSITDPDVRVQYSCRTSYIDN